jgi:predicted DNA-binding transcriptional regulator YafY
LDAETQSVDEDHHLRKRWRLDASLPAGLYELTDIERSTLETMLESLPSGAERLALSKLLAAQRPPGTRASIDQETLIERTAHLGRVGPRTTLSETLMQQLELGIQSFQQLNITYHTPRTRKPTPRRVKPLGFVFGRFGYLVAQLSGRDIRTYRLDLISAVEDAGQGFTYPRWFNLKTWADESFGIYHGDELKTHVIEFSPKVADRAESVRFHSSEKKERLKNGSLRVTLRCRGHKELMWELSHPDWDGEVQVQ